MDEPKYSVGQQFQKVGGDYQFKGEIVAVFRKKNGIIRYVGENSDGLLFIFNEGAISLLETSSHTVSSVPQD